MSHFTVMVIGPKNQDELEDALQPFHEFECTGYNDQYVIEVDKTEELLPDYLQSDVFASYADYDGQKVVTDLSKLDLGGAHKYGYILRLPTDDGEVIRFIRRTNPNKKWDWWVVGGRWSGMLLSKSIGNPEACNVLRIRDLDLFSMRYRKIKESNEQFDKWCAAQKDLPVAQTWQEVLAKHGEDQVDAARREFHSQLRVQALTEFGFYFESIDAYPCVPGVDSDYTIQQARLEAGKNAAQKCLSTFAILDARKSPPMWHQRGKMGWWAVVSDEMDAGQWDREVLALVKSLDGDTMITIVDCHI